MLIVKRVPSRLYHFFLVCSIYNSDNVLLFFMSGKTILISCLAKIYLHVKVHIFTIDIEVQGENILGVT